MCMPTQPIIMHSAAHSNGSTTSNADATATNNAMNNNSNAAHLGSHRSYISPLAIKRAMCGEQWVGLRQQDTHEYFVALLDQMQHEVLGAQVCSVRGYGYAVVCL